MKSLTRHLLTAFIPLTLAPMALCSLWAGYVVTAGPEAAVFSKPAYAVCGLSVVFVILATLAVYFINRAANNFVAPLAKIASGISEILEAIAGRLPEVSKGSVNPAKNHLPLELARLESGLAQLKHLVDAWEAAEDRLILSQRKMLQSAKMSALGEMAGGMAHEINSPLSVISLRANQIQRLLSGHLPDTQRAKELALVVEQTSERIAVIIRGLRTFARGADKDPHEVFHISEALDDTLALSAERFRLHGVGLRIETPFAGAMVRGQKVQICQVLLNLLNNAFDAVEKLPQKWVQIGFSDLGSNFKVTITDSGPGIPSQLREKIMLPFYTTKEADKGTGLGLSISKSIVEEHHGTLVLDESCDQTSFIVTLPKGAIAQAPENGHRHESMPKTF